MFIQMLSLGWPRKTDACFRSHLDFWLTHTLTASFAAVTAVIAAIEEIERAAARAATAGAPVPGFLQ